MGKKEEIETARFNMSGGRFEIGLGIGVMIFGALEEQGIITLGSDPKLFGFLILAAGAFAAGAGRWSLNRARAKRDAAQAEN